MSEKPPAREDEPASPGASGAAGSTTASNGTSAPVLVDLGKKRRKHIKLLKRGEGPIIAELADVVEQVRTELGAELAGKTLLPVVLIYEKRLRRSWFGLPPVG